MSDLGSEPTSTGSEPTSTGSGGKTGARRPARGGEAPRGKTTTYRGIRWRKDPDGTIGWLNEEAGGWLRWKPGGDAPPLPPAWEDDAAAIPAPPRVRRASWRSPYRLVPIGLVVAAVILGIVQATRTGSDTAATAAANKDAHALLGKCLATKSPKSAAYSTTPVSCGSSSAEVKVITVLRAGSGTGACPTSTTALELSYIGTRTPDIECVRPVTHGLGG